MAMKAMILAAGRGERMRPLTDSVPKPLLEVSGKTLIEYHIEALVHAGIRELVINHSFLGSKIEEVLGDGNRFGASIRYSPEPEGAFETGGGIYHALPLLGEQPFVIVNGDTWTDFLFADLVPDPSSLVHLVMVANPPHHREGDFCLQDGRLLRQGKPKFTYSGIGVIRPELFQACVSGRFSLAPLLYGAIDQACASGQHHDGNWSDIGTPERLLQLQQQLSGSQSLNQEKNGTGNQ